jgi:hypothetical protein
VSGDTLTLIGMAIVSVALALVSNFGRRRGIAEARFDSENGKQTFDD